MEDLKPVRVFLEVASQLSFTNAARTLRMTPASVTRIVSKLERQLGQQLLVRTTRQVSLTSAGAVAVARYRPLVDEIDAVTEDIIRASRPDLGRLRINAPLSFGVRVLPNAVESFRLAYPRIDLDIYLTDTLVDILEEDCDLSIRISDPPTDKSTIWRKLCDIPRYAVAAPSLFERIPAPATPQDLNPDTMLAYSTTGDTEAWEFRKEGQRRVFRTGTSLVSNNGDFLASIARAGGGICALPDFIVKDDLDAGTLLHVLPDWTLKPLSLNLYYPPYEKLPPLVGTFTDFFEAYLREIEGLVF